MPQNPTNTSLNRSALRCEQSARRPSYWNLANGALFTRAANPVSLINPGSRRFTEPGNTSYGGKA